MEPFEHDVGAAGFERVEYARESLAIVAPIEIHGDGISNDDVICFCGSQIEHIVHAETNIGEFWIGSAMIDSRQSKISPSQSQLRHQPTKMAQQISRGASDIK